MKRRANGFTLVELLVVIAIIAIMISILLPALSKARATAQSTVCRSNLRQMYMSFQLYVDKFRGWLPMPRYAWSAPGITARSWYDELDENGGGVLPLGTRWTTNRIWVCPTYVLVIPIWYQKVSGSGWLTYGMNMSLNNGGRHRMSQIRNTSEKFLMADGFDRSGDIPYAVLSFFEYYWLDPTKVSGGFGLFHPSNSANVLFFDGHVDGRRVGEWPNYAMRYTQRYNIFWEP